MAAVRVYLPMTAGLLREAVEQGRFGPAPLRGHAVTAALTAELVDGDEEEWEHAAMTAAALDAVPLLAPGDPPLRMVAAVDVSGYDPSPDPDPEPSAVSLPHEVPLRRLASVQVDAPDAEPEVAAARDGVEGAVERCLDHELGWYAAQEVGDLLARWAPRSSGD